MITPYFAGDAVTLYTGDAVEVLRELPDNAADCVVTSPPYWGLRDYGTGSWTGGNPTCTHSTGPGTSTPPPDHPSTPNPASAAQRASNPRTCRRCGAVRNDRQYGLEATPEEYVDALRAVFAELRRVLTATGTVWLNMGDSYSTTPPGRAGDPMRTSTARRRRALGALRDSVQRAGVDRTLALPRKNLVGMPWRVAFALQADGWILRNAVVWHKPNAMPESVHDRLSNRYELVFLLVQQPRYVFDLDAIRQPLARREALEEGIIGGSRKGRRAGIDATERRRGRSVYGSGKYTDDTAFSAHPPGEVLRPTGRRHTAAHSKGKNPGDVWSMTTRPLRAAHFAAFPVDLPLRCIAAGCPPRGTVLDPFSGAATTGLAARQLKHQFIGIDLRSDFHDIGLDRLGLPRPRNHRAAGQEGRMNQRPRAARGQAPAQPAVSLLTGDATTVLRTLPDGSADCVVTSPPYWRLRDYGTGSWTGGSPTCPHPDTTALNGAPTSASASRHCTRCGATWTDQQYGLESTPQAYVQHLRKVFAQLRRVLADTGTAWLNLGDSYSTNSDGYWCTRPGQYRQPRYRPRADVPHKNLIGMPWRVAQALQNDGWILRNAIIWHKPNTLPFPSRDRLTCRYETLFLLVKQPHYFFDLNPIRQPYTGTRSLSRRTHRGGNKPHTASGIWPPPGRTPTALPLPPGRNPGDVWTVPVTPGQHQSHPAAFPIDIPLRCIAAGCPPHGTVLDPFSGTGSTGEAAISLNHPYTGIDLNPAFHRHALTRLHDVVPSAGATVDNPVGPRREAG